MLKIFLDGCLVHEILSCILENNVSSDFSLKSRFVPFKFSSHVFKIPRHLCNVKASLPQHFQWMEE